MKVAFFLDKFPTISETFIRNQITGLIDLGHEITIFCHPNEDPDVWELEDVKNYQLRQYIVDRSFSIPMNKFKRLFIGIQIIAKYWSVNYRQLIESCNFFKYGKKSVDLTFLFRISPFLGHSFDILQCHFGHVANQAVILKQMKFDFKFQVMFHGFDIRLGVASGGEVYRDLISNVDRVLSISFYNRKNLIDFGFSEHQIIHHPVGVDVNIFSKKNKYHQKDEINILSIGRLVEEKDYDSGIKAVSELVQEYGYDVTYNIIGEGVQRADLLSLVNELGIEDRVHFLGAKDRNEIIRLLHMSDIFYLPSKAEALPVVLMEALAVGLPVVATDVGSVKELVVDGVSGFLAESQDINSLICQLNKLIEAKADWEIMGEKGSHHIFSNYNINELNKKLISY
ncbi:glycosyltransferase [Persicobacter psychrovividus]|uniref:Colanic acid biosynthesis glycosyltransferase WcaL n=1 Tax=Persicobacter psychrovividus TaxID=387638 RepID=A0ABM7VCI2_9BACT|nr:colanic acid biosynthesis glycosyltransferase WcaL [Persicobacter psychrovividus]